MGVPTAAARWSGPVSPDTMSRAPRASASTSPIRVGGAGRAAPPDASATARARSPSAGPHSTSDGEPVAISQPRGDLAETARRPALVRPRGARIKSAYGPSTAGCCRGTSNGNAIVRYVDAERRLRGGGSSRSRAGRAARRDARCRTRQPCAPAAHAVRIPPRAPPPTTARRTADLSSPWKSSAAS